MKTIEFKAYVSTNMVGSEVEDLLCVYVGDDATDEEIEEAKEAVTREWMFENIEWGWRDIKE
jgi:outer membrane protein assembly factor BamA